MIEVELSLGGAQADVDALLRSWSETDVVPRLWRRDPTLWSSDPETPELADRLGWLDLPDAPEGFLAGLESLRASIPFWMTDVVLLGMGGSSLAPEVLDKTQPGEGLPLTVLDTTHPVALRDVEWLNPANTFFIVASKSGTTLETLSLFRHFWSRTAEVVGNPADHFIAVTDPGSSLAALAQERGFRALFEAPPDVGGRFSALSPFGLVPAAMMGHDVVSILGSATEAVDACQEDVGHNPGAQLGAALASLTRAGRDKVTFVSSDDWAAFPDWAEQLIAESTGKDGKGIVPIAHEPRFEPDAYGDDRVFVGLVTAGAAAAEAAQWGEDDDTPDTLDALEAAGHPVIRIHLEEAADIGALFFVWEVATALAGSALGIHPFNQPDVQLAKQLAREAMSADVEGEDEADDAIDLLWEQPRYGRAPARVMPEPDVEGIRSRLYEWLEGIEAGDYIGIQAYLSGHTPEEDELLYELRENLTRVTGVATTLGVGPRFLHSTGQLHKGGPDTGAFVQLIDDADAHVHVPETDFTFRQLIRAQAHGDLGALLQKGRRTIQVRVGDEEGIGLKRLIQLVDEYGEGHE